MTGETLTGLWRERLEEDPQRTILLKTHRRPVTAAMIEEKIRSQVLRLGALPRLRGRVIGLALPNSSDWLASFLAILRAGAVALPLDPGTDQARSVVESVGGTAFIDQAGIQEWSTRRRRLPATICLAKLTSGSTGRPTPHFFTHTEMIADGRQVQEGMGIGPDDINFAVIPFGHSYGLGNFVMPMLRSGTAVALGRSILPRELLTDMATTSATVFAAVPAIIHALTIADLPEYRLGRIRIVISAGGRLPGVTARRFRERFGLKVRGFYGSTETGGISFDSDGDDTCAERSVGKPLPGVEVERSTTGRLLVTSPAAFTHGNRRRSGSGTGQVLLADLGRIHTDGSISLIGRRRGFVKRAGRRISLAEVEGLARTIPGVREAWATVIRSEEGGEAIGLAIETDGTTPEMRARIREHLPKRQRPAKVICLGAFPSTPRGKVSTAELKDLFE